MRILAGVLALTTLLAACTDDDTTLTGSAPPASTQTPAGQPRSFTKDIIPILTGSCALSSCHGDVTASAGVGIFLPIGDPNGIYDALLNKTSTDAQGAHFVVAGDPSKSFLVAKLNGNFSAYTSVCANKDCGQIMPPPPTAALDASDVQQVTLWIMEGAKNN